MIHAIIFDCFGVLCKDSWLPFKEEHFGHDPILWSQATELNILCDAGQVPYQDFIEQVGQMAGMAAAEVDHATSQNPVDEQVFEYIAQNLQGNYKLGLLSNAGENWLNEIFRPEQISLFTATVLSHEVGVTKPHPKMYQTIAARLGIPLAECILIDDQASYVDGARRAGMQAISYTDIAQLREELGRLLADPQ